MGKPTTIGNRVEHLRVVQEREISEKRDNSFVGVIFQLWICLLTVFCWKVKLQQLELTGSYFMVELSIQDDYVSYEVTNEQPVCGLSTSP